MSMQQRQTEAEIIAAAEGYAIAAHDDDWTYFALADDLLIEHGAAAGNWCHTFFVWDDWKFEGAVSLTRSDAR